MEGEKKFMPIVQTKFTGPALGSKKLSVHSNTLQHRTFLDYAVKRNSLPPGHRGQGRRRENLKHQLKLKEYDIGSPITPTINNKNATTAASG